MYEPGIRIYDEDRGWLVLGEVIRRIHDHNANPSTASEVVRLFYTERCNHYVMDLSEGWSMKVTVLAVPKSDDVAPKGLGWRREIARLHRHLQVWRHLDVCILSGTRDGALRLRDTSGDEIELE